MNAYTSFTAPSTVASGDERDDGALDGLPACAMDAAIELVLGPLEEEADAP